MNEIVKNIKSKYQYGLERIEQARAQSTPERIAEQFGRLFDDICNNWDCIAEYIAHPEADLYRIAEVYTYAPEFVMQQTRWPQIEQHRDWPAALARPKRRLPTYVGIVPAYYLETLLMSGPGKTVAACLERRSIKAEQYFDRLVSRADQSIDMYLAERETRAEWLQHFASSKFISVRLRVAQNRHTPPEVLRVLCVDSNAKVAHEASSHENFPADAAQLIAAAEEAKVVAKLDNLEALDWKALGEFFTNPDLPSEMLAQLAQRDEPHVLFACSMHPNAPESVWRRSLEQSEPWQRAAVALNPAVPESVLVELSADDGFDIAFALACNARVPEAIQLKLARHAERAIRHHIADQTRSPEVWAEVARHPGPKTLRSPLEFFLGAAVDPKTPSKKLKGMHSVTNRSRSDGEVLASAISNAIALHPKYPLELLAEYRFYLPWLEQQNKTVSLMVLEGARLPSPRPYLDWKLTGGGVPRLPAHVANYMIVNGDLTEQRIGAGHPRCNRALLIPLLFSTDTVLLKKLAQREHMPRFFYEILWATNPDTVRKVLIDNPAASARGASFTKSGAASAELKPAIAVATVTQKGTVKVSGNKKQRAELAENTADYTAMRTLVNDRMVDVRINLAGNPDIADHDDIWMSLATDSESSVRRALAFNRRLPWKALERLAADVDPSVVQSLPLRLREFPPETTRAVEEHWLTLDSRMKERLASAAGNESVQLKLVAAYGDRLARNPRCTHGTAVALLRHGHLNPSDLAKIAGHVRENEGLERAAAFVVDAARLLLSALQQGQGADAMFAEIYPDATEEERQRYRAGLKDFLDGMQQARDGLMSAYRSLVGLMKVGADSRSVSDMMGGLFDLQGLKHDVRRELIAFLLEYCPTAPASTLEKLVEEPSQRIRMKLARRTDLPEGVIGKLAQDQVNGVRAAIAETHPSAAARLIDDRSEDVRESVAKVIRDVEMQRKFLNDESPGVVQALASNEHCAPEILDQLARHRRAHVRGEVACNENASALTLTHLLDDMSKEVRSYAMCTLACCASDADLQMRLLEEGDGSAFLELAQNPACCDAVLERLAGHADVIVRREVASNPRLSATLLDVMLRDADRSVREHAQRASSEREAVSA